MSSHSRAPRAIPIGVAFFMHAALAVLAIGCSPEPTPQPPNVMLVVMDTLRSDRVSSYGYHRPTTPQLDAVADAGVLFEDVTAPGSWTWPSHASLFTGEPPWVHGAHLVPAEGDESDVFGMNVSSMRADLPTLAERFSGSDFRTVAIVANRWLSPDLGLTRGFESVQVVEDDAAVIAAARAEITRADDRPLFLFINLMSAHSPYRSGPGPWGVDDASILEPDTAAAWLRPYLTTDLPRGVNLPRVTEPFELGGVTRYYAGDLAIPDDGLQLMSFLYDAGVRGADFAFGQILGDWVARDPEGIVVVTSDHGEAFGEHGQLDHRASVYPEMLRVPLVLAAPGRLPAGLRVSHPVRLQDIHPTLLELAGLAAPRSGSLLPLIRGEVDSRVVSAMAWPVEAWARHAGGRFEQTWWMYREGSLALVSDGRGTTELYDLGDDPGMTHDRSRGDPARVTALLASALETLEAPPEAQATRAAEISKETQERLRHLGYGD